MPAFGRKGLAGVGRLRALGLGVLSTGVVCPCHALVGLVGLAMGGQVLSPAAQDGVHAVYVPFAVLTGALLLGKGAAVRHRRESVPKI